MIIAVIGTGAGCSKEAYALGEQVGREIGARGHTLICGGLNGIMEAACKGAKSAGGTTIGILPTDNPADANRWVDIPIATGMGYARNLIVVRSAQAVIAIDGAFGTLSEIAHARGYGLPVIGLKTWTIHRPDGLDPGIIVAHDPRDAVEKAVAAGQQQAATPTQRRN